MSGTLTSTSYANESVCCCLLRICVVLSGTLTSTSCANESVVVLSGTLTSTSCANESVCCCLLTRTSSSNDHFIDYVNFLLFTEFFWEREFIWLG